MTDPEITWSPPKTRYVLIEYDQVVASFEAQGWKEAKSIKESFSKDYGLKTDLYIKVK